MNKLIYISLISLLFACNSGIEDQSMEDNKKSEPEPQVITETLEIPEIKSDSMYYYIQKQLSFGPRVPGTLGHRQCGDFLVKELKSFGPNTPEVTEQTTTAVTFDKKQIPVRNIIASFNPKNGDRILLAAHWDTRPFAEMDKKKPPEPISGANDGASGVAVLLELARQFALHNPETGVDIIFFDAEDWGDTMGRTEDSYCLGSQYWAKNPHQPGYFANFGILLDMVGGKEAKFAVEGNSWKMARSIVENVWGTAARLGYQEYFIERSRGSVIDDHYYVMKHRQIPMIDIIAYDPDSYSHFGHFWHTHDDNLEIIDEKTLHAVGQTVITVVYEQAAALRKKVN
jgi:Zn-dependent M28 family amino/carboxypeptidase